MEPVLKYNSTFTLEDLSKGKALQVSPDLIDPHPQFLVVLKPERYPSFCSSCVTPAALATYICPLLLQPPPKGQATLPTISNCSADPAAAILRYIALSLTPTNPAKAKSYLQPDLHLAKATTAAPQLLHHHTFDGSVYTRLAAAGNARKKISFCSSLAWDELRH